MAINRMTDIIGELMDNLGDTNRVEELIDEFKRNLSDHCERKTPECCYETVHELMRLLDNLSGFCCFVLMDSDSPDERQLLNRIFSAVVTFSRSLACSCLNCYNI